MGSMTGAFLTSVTVTSTVTSGRPTACPASPFQTDTFRTTDTEKNGVRSKLGFLEATRMTKSPVVESWVMLNRAGTPAASGGDWLAMAAATMVSPSGSVMLACGNRATSVPRGEFSCNAT